MRKFRLFGTLIKRSGAEKVLVGFAAVYLVGALLTMIFEPGINTYGDALWFLWAVSITVGLGDFTAVTIVGRGVTVLCSLYAVITTAIITGVVVDYFHEVRELQLNASLTEFLDRLEHLPELDRDELERISKRVKELRRK